MNIPLVKWPLNGVVLLIHRGEPLVAEQLAFEYAKKWLCEGQSLDQTHQHTLFDCGTHPDFYFLRPEADLKWIKIDQVRAFNQWTITKPSIAKGHVGIISPAHQLNIQAANALLKTLEEIPFSTLLILVTDKPSLLPATVRSRCYWIRLGNALASENDLVLVQRIKHDLKGLTLGSLNFVSIADQWAEQDPKQIVAILWQILVERTLKYAQKGEMSTNPRWWSLIDNIIQARKALEAPNQPNL